MVTRGKWWGRFPLDEILFWRVGPLSLWIRRASLEWRVDWKRGEDPLDETLEVARTDVEAPADGVEGVRVGLRDSVTDVEVQPALADLPAVVRPANPFHLPPGEESVLYVSSPLWIYLHAGATGPRILELPIIHPKPTWIGPNTRTGELCYALLTRARLQLESVPVPPQRALTAVRIRNRAGTRFSIERFKLPLAHLSLFTDASGQLWTQSVILERGADEKQGEVRLESGPPGRKSDFTLVGDPRKPIVRGFLRGALEGIFSLGERDG